jgi:uncharacterized membrane protein YjjP (DUF1212 family)/uncharacterized membrane protein YjjB (DUF3815 family)
MTATDAHPAETPDISGCRERLDVLLHFAIANAEAGRSTTETVATVRACATALGMPALTIFSSGRTFMLEHVLPSGEALTRMGSATTVDAIDCERLRRLDRVSADIECGRVRVGGVRRVTDAAVGTARPWWWAAAGMTVLAACIALQIGASPIAALLAAALQVLVSAIGALATAARVGALRLFVVATQCVVGAAFVGALHALGALSWIEAATCLAVSWLLLVPLPSLLTLVVDAVNSEYLAAASRAAVSTLVVGGIVFGGGVVLAIVDHLGLRGPGDFDLPTLAVPLVLVFSALGAMANGVANGGGRRLLLPAAAIGVVTAACNQALIHLMGLDAQWASIASAVVLGIGSALWARILPYPAPVLALVGITGALLPGLVVLRGVVLELFHTSGLLFFGQAVVICFDLGVGATLGFHLVSRLSRIRTP